MSITAAEVIQLFEDGDKKSLETIERGEWEVDHKHEYRSTIVKHVPSGRHFAIDQSRSGSYWTDYEFDEPTAREVVPKEVTVIQWVTAT